MGSWVASYGNKHAKRAWNLAELEIYISANRLEQALSMIKRIRGAGPADSQSISLAAVVFAKQGAWELLERLLTTAQDSNMLKFDAEVTVRFNNVIRLYARQHSDVATWKFVVAAVHDLGFVPSYATTEIMLEVFVKGHSINLIPKWLQYVHTLGQKFDMSAKAATKLLTHYYLEHRPSHVLVMWFCRNLTHFAPSLAGPQYVDLAKEAIGYDLRKRVGNDRAWRESAAQQRLALLDQTGDIMPSPGYRWNGQLYFEPPPGVAAPLSAAAVRRKQTRQTISPGTHALTPLTESWNPVASASKGQDRPRHANMPSAIPSTENLQGDPFASFFGTTDEPSENIQQNPFAASSTTAVIADALTPLMESLNPVGNASKGQDQPRNANMPLARPSRENIQDDPFAAFSTDALPDPTTNIHHLGTLAQTSESNTPEEELLSTVKFGDLRSTYSDDKLSPLTDTGEQPAVQETMGLYDAYPTNRALERDMILALSLAQYARVLDLYRNSLDAVGLPVSPLALEVTVEASLRLHRGQRDDAERIMRQARDAGMNVTCAMGPMLIHQMYHLTPTGKNDANNLRVSVIEYYRMNGENGWPVKHHVGVTAANILIDNRQPEHGINILDAIYRSEWAQQRKLDIVAMTVFVKGYAALRSMTGLQWAVETVLAQNMRIDRKFLATLRNVQKMYARTAHTTVPRKIGQRQGIASIVPVLVSWSQLCYERRAKQMLESKLLGKRLVACLAKCANGQLEQAIDVSLRGEIEDAIFGKPIFGRQTLPYDSPPGEVGVVGAPEPPRTRYLERLESHVARSIRAEHTLHRRGPRRRLPRKYDREWILQYRAFLRKNMEMCRGTLATFKYRVAPPEITLPKDRGD
ncbi:hypothetical protein LTR08_008035 [Meristemomyces frigidus]|nr:hypothetical protein LTR08_008035 [Meristemomyces frigidus]